VKLIVQIPCFNEQEDLWHTIRQIPRQIDGVDEVEVLVIDDGSRDRSREIADEAGADHVVRHRRNMGLGWTFRTGLDTALALGADVIVNLDADNQYDARAIGALIKPILEGRADIVIGDRAPGSSPHFSWIKRNLQKLGSLVVARLSGIEVPDAVSGFRALSREAAIRTVILSPFSYTIEMLVEAGRKRLSVTSVPVGTNKVERESRLFRSIPQFLAKSGTLLLRMFTMYHPLRVFTVVGGALAIFGMVPIGRFLVLAAMGDGQGHVQSLVLGGTLIVVGFLALLIGIVADLVGFNRQLLEIALERIKRIELHLGDSKGLPRRDDSGPGGRPASMTVPLERVRRGL
jgi:glycosyltransferase involved in cell wall biosynthesis